MRTLRCRAKKYEGNVGGQGGIVFLRAATAAMRTPDTVEGDELHEEFCVQLVAWRVAGSDLHDA